jgi:DNA-binding GntR family transcriptional regulator
MSNRALYKDKSLSTVAYEKILNWIQSYEYKPGDALVESDLSKRLKISRTPVREALQRLEGEHLVEIRKGVGTFVAQVTLEEIRHICEIREAIEGMMCRLACRKHVDTAPLQKIKRGLESVASLKDGTHRLERFQELGYQMHDFILDVCDNLRLTAIRRTIAHQIRYHQYTTKMIPVFIEESVPEHQKIIDALISKEADRAECAMKTHIRNTLHRILDSYKQ